jgi:hypothetical protein
MHDSSTTVLNLIREHGCPAIPFDAVKQLAGPHVAQRIGTQVGNPPQGRPEHGARIRLLPSRPGPWGALDGSDAGARYDEALTVLGVPRSPWLVADHDAGADQPAGGTIDRGIRALRGAVATLGTALEDGSPERHARWWALIREWSRAEARLAKLRYGPCRPADDESIRSTTRHRHPRPRG